MKDIFKGDNEKLVESIVALLELDDANSLQRGLGGHARVLLAAAAVRLSRPSSLHKHSGKMRKLRIGRLVFMLATAEDPKRPALLRTWAHKIEDTGGAIDERIACIGFMKEPKDKFTIYYLMLGPLCLGITWIR